MNKVENQFLWVESYRPQTLEDCILPSSLLDTFKQFVERGEISNLLLCGSAGTRKTTVARALCNELGCDYIIINGSEESGIDVLRTKIKNFASTISLTDSKKVVILDEADYLNPNSTQPALRAFIEEFSNNCRFIFTCNYKNRIIEPLHSRCSVVDFKIENKDKQEIAASFFKRLTHILDTENIQYDPKPIVELVTKHLPDWRRVINELQRYSVTGKIDSGILLNLTEESFKQLIKNLKDKNFTEVRKWVAKNGDSDSINIFRQLYDTASTNLESGSIPQLVLILSDYQYKAAFVADHELNMMAALTEIMAQCKFK